MRITKEALIFWLLCVMFGAITCWVCGCRCIYIKTGNVTACGCSLVSSTGIENAVIEPNKIQSGNYNGNADNVNVVLPNGIIVGTKGDDKDE